MGLPLRLSIATFQSDFDQLFKNLTYLQDGCCSHDAAEGTGPDLNGPATWFDMRQPVDRAVLVAIR